MAVLEVTTAVAQKEVGTEVAVVVIAAAHGEEVAMGAPAAVAAVEEGSADMSRIA